MISKSTEEYLKTIYVLYKQNNEIRVTDIAQRMNCSKPSVTKQLNILSENKLIIYETYGKIELTDKELDLFGHCVEAHMGPWNTDYDGNEILPKPKTK